MSAATAAATEMTAASSAAKMSTTTPAATAATAETAASGVSSRRQTQRKAYCGRARRDFPHDMTSSSGQMRKSTPDRPVPFRRIEP
jgi:hypothetical protein